MEILSDSYHFTVNAITNNYKEGPKKKLVGVFADFLFF